jgi:hypothetical protein
MALGLNSFLRRGRYLAVPCEHFLSVSKIKKLWAKSIAPHQQGPLSSKGVMGNPALNVSPHPPQISLDAQPSKSIGYLFAQMLVIPQ